LLTTLPPRPPKAKEQLTQLREKKLESEGALEASSLRCSQLEAELQQSIMAQGIASVSAADANVAVGAVPALQEQLAALEAKNKKGLAKSKELLAKNKALGARGEELAEQVETDREVSATLEAAAAAATAQVAELQAKAEEDRAGAKAKAEAQLAEIAALLEAKVRYCCSYC